MKFGCTEWIEDFLKKNISIPKSQQNRQHNGHIFYLIHKSMNEKFIY